MKYIILSKKIGSHTINPHKSTPYTIKKKAIKVINKKKIILPNKPITINNIAINNTAIQIEPANCSTKK